MNFNIVNDKGDYIDIYLKENYSGDIDLICGGIPLLSVRKIGIIKLFPNYMKEKEEMGFECYPNGEVKAVSF